LLFIPRIGVGDNNTFSSQRHREILACHTEQLTKQQTLQMQWFVEIRNKKSNSVSSGKYSEKSKYFNDIWRRYNVQIA